MFVCLWFNVPLKNISLILRRHCYRWRIKNMTYTRHSWLLSSEGSLACHTYCDTGHPFIMVISEDHWHSHLLPSAWKWSCHHLFLRLTCSSVATANRILISRMRGKRFTTESLRMSIYYYGMFVFFARRQI